MHILTSPLSPFKRRSHSQPHLPHIPLAIHSIHRNRNCNLSPSKDPPDLLPLISLQGYRDQSEELDHKIKGLQKRNLRKLEERYDTIDRWKERYIPQSSVLLIRQKMSIENVFPRIQGGGEVRRSSPGLSALQLLKQQKLGQLSVKSSSMVADDRQLRRRLQLELMSRLQRNKKSHPMDNLLQPVNYFEKSNQYNFDIKNSKYKIIHNPNNLEDRQNDNFRNKIKLLKIHPNHKLQLKKANSSNSRQYSNPEEDKFEVGEGARLRKAMSIFELKEDLMKETVEETPQGWSVQQQLADDQQ